MAAAGKAARRKHSRRRTPKKMMALRVKFIEQCKKYIGIPYKRKYHEPETPEYNSPLFLDCCGLIRRVLQDMKSDFGFDIGPWNQTYMYDTLPNTLVRESSMKPGDLVFISGVYFNQKMKPQVHGIVHVEVWLGDGRKTIGARWHKGAVQIFDSYRFQSTSYHSMKYHFKSITPWLMGVCKSHCPLHAWRLPSDYRPSKRSVLRIKRQQQNLSDVDQTEKLPSENSSKPLQEKSEESPTTEDGEEEATSKNDSDLASLISASSSEDSQETLMRDLLLEGSNIDSLTEKLRILPVKDMSSPSLKESLTFIQVTKSLGSSSLPSSDDNDAVASH